MNTESYSQVFGVGIFPFWCCQHCDIPVGDDIGGTGGCCRLVALATTMSNYIKGVTAVIPFTGITFCLAFQSLVNLMNPAYRWIQKLEAAPRCYGRKL